MSRFHRSKKLISLCRQNEQQESINRLARELERESDLLLQPSEILPSNSEDQDTMDITNAHTDHQNNISMAGVEITPVKTGTTQSIITTTAVTTDISEIVNPCSIAQNYSEIPSNKNPGDFNEVSYQLNDKTGYLEPITMEKENMNSSNMPEAEVFISETRKRKKNQKMRLLGKHYLGHKVKKVDTITKLEVISKSDRQLREKPCSHGA